jgi:outer membrane receptor for ferrienterochelin and colicin
VSHERVSGIIASGDWRVDAGRFGDFTFGARYNVTMDHTYQQYPGDPDHDLLHEPRWSSEFKTIANASVTWDVGKWSTTIQGQRYGATPNYAAQVYGWEGGGDQYSQAGTVGPWFVYNGSVTYNVTPDITTKLIVQNIFDKMPPKDQTWVGWPYYNQFNYTPWGRAIWLDLNIHFGSGS